MAARKRVTLSQLAIAWTMSQGTVPIPGTRRPRYLAEVLQALAADFGVVQTVVTGNLRPLAVAKLTTLGLGQNLDFTIGGYGEDALYRWELVKAAKQRAMAKLGVEFTERNTVVIGDIPHDVDAALRGGAAIIGVATGLTDADGLRAAGARVGLPNLEDAARVSSAVERVTGTMEHEAELR